MKAHTHKHPDFIFIDNEMLLIEFIIWNGPLNSITHGIFIINKKKKTCIS